MSTIVRKKHSQTKLSRAFDEQKQLRQSTSFDLVTSRLEANIDQLLILLFKTK